MDSVLIVRGAYVQDKVRPGTGREGALGYERYFAIRVQGWTQ